MMVMVLMFYGGDARVVVQLIVRIYDLYVQVTLALVAGIMKLHLHVLTVDTRLAVAVITAEITLVHVVHTIVLILKQVDVRCMSIVLVVATI